MEEEEGEGKAQVMARALSQVRPSIAGERRLFRALDRHENPATGQPADAGQLSQGCLSASACVAVAHTFARWKEAGGNDALAERN